MRLKLTKKELLKNLLWVAVLAGGITLYYYSQYKTLMVQDSLFLSGLFFLCIGLYRVVRYLGLFDNTIYGFKKLTGRAEENGRKLDYHDYWSEHAYTKPVWEVLLVSVCAMALGLIG